MFNYSMLKTQNMDINVMETASQLNQYYWELLGTPQMIMSVACLRSTMRSPAASNAFKNRLLATASTEIHFSSTFFAAKVRNTDATALPKGVFIAIKRKKSLRVGLL